MLVLGVLAPALLALAYLGCLITVRRRGESWAWPRVLAFSTGIGILAWTFNGYPEAHRSHDWVMSLAIGLVGVIAAFLIALGDPVRLLAAATGRRCPASLRRVLAVASFPILASVANAAVLIAVYALAFRPAQHSDIAWSATLATVFLSGLWVNVPLLTDGLLPAWCTPGWRTLFGAIDGILDEVPCVVVLAMINTVAGGTLLVLTQVVALPMTGALLFTWVRDDFRRARDLDAELDAADSVAADPEVPWWERG